MLPFNPLNPKVPKLGDPNPDPKKMCFCVSVCLLTVAPVSSMALTKATASDVQERTVSVRPSLNIRVIDDSYVRQNTPWS